jgi:hypothetical protein
MKAIVKAPLRYDGVELICTRMKGQLPHASAPRQLSGSLARGFSAERRPDVQHKSIRGGAETKRGSFGWGLNATKHEGLE